MAKDFRDHAIEKALDEAVPAFRPERTRRARLKRIAAVAVVTALALAAFWALLHYSSPRTGARKPAKPIPIELVPAPPRGR